jgi:ABC-type Fe3+ transport system permease subunit
MVRLDVLHAQYVLLALFAGVLLVGYTILVYLAFWKSREKVAEEQEGARGDTLSTLAWLRSFMPWALTILILATLAFMIAYLVHFAYEPPNW